MMSCNANFPIFLRFLYNINVKNRVKGYVKGENGFENCEYVSPTIFYSAGGLLSTIDDFNKFKRINDVRTRDPI